MATQHDTTAPACDALAAWDKLFNERQSRRPAVEPAHDNTVICQFREGPECLRVWNELQDTRARVVRLLDRFPDDAIHDGTLPPDAFPDLMDALIDLGKVEAYLCRAWARSTNEPVPDERGARVG